MTAISVLCWRPAVGHDTHFLSRLDRVEGPALDLALGLYRDSALMRWALSRLPLADQTEVVALPLSPAPEPPYALVSRKGKFITCLAEGMRPEWSQIIRWEQLDGAQGEWRGIQAIQAQGPNRAVVVYGRMGSAGPWLAREDFEDLQVLAALKPRTFSRVCSESTLVWLIERESYRPRDFQVFTDEKKRRLSHAWKSAWASSHALVALVEATLHLHTVREKALPVDLLIDLAMSTAEPSFDGLLIRAGWSLSRLGPAIVPPLATRLHAGIAYEANPSGPQASWASQATSLYALVALAARDPASRPAVVEVLEACAGDVVAGYEAESADALYTALLENKPPLLACSCALALRLLQEAGEGFPTGKSALRGLLRSILLPQDADAFPSGPPRRSPRPATPGGRAERATGGASDGERSPEGRSEPRTLRPGPDYQIPHELLHVPPFSLSGHASVHPGLVIDRLRIIPPLATEPPGGLFLPRMWIESLNRRLQLTTPVERVRDLLNQEFACFHTAMRPKPNPTTGRNEPCPCGSGQKFKKCCGR